MKRPRYLARISAAYVSAAGGDRLAAAADRSGLRVLMDVPNLLVFTDATDEQVIELSSGVLIGTAFAKSEGYRRIGCLSALDRTRFDNDILSEVWGAWVAFVAPQDGSPLSVLRSPFGGLPCYYVREGWTFFLSSEADLLIDGGVLEPAIDAGFVRQHLLRSQLRTSRTGLVGLREVLGGQKLLVGEGKGEEVAFWSPWHWCESGRQIKDRHEARDRLRSGILDAIGAWASTYRHVVLGVSGGLDSSIVAAGVVRSGTPISCLTLIGPDASGDERRFTRMLADHLDISVAERWDDEDLVDLRHSASAHVPRPIARCFAQSGDHHNQEICLEAGGDVFFSGAGGDNIFCYQQSPRPLADHLLSRWPSGETWNVLSSISEMSGSGVFEVGWKSLRAMLPHRRNYRWRNDLSFLRPELFEAEDLLADHPWLSPPPGILPGSAGHVALLLYIQNHLDGFERERDHDVIAPLLSQPVVETCLRIPSWMWFSRGYHRAIAREAFEDLISPNLAWRKSKGSPDGFAAQLFLNQRSEIREILNEGYLVSQGLIDIDHLNVALADGTPMKDASYWRILSFVDLEAWLAVWQAKKRAVCGANGRRAA